MKMACLQNGTTLLNNNNLSSFKHNIMKYDETHANVYTSQINNFLNNQIPFRNNHTKDKTQSDNVFNEDEQENDDEMKHSCANERNAPSDDDEDGDGEEQECRTINKHNKNNDNNNDNNNEITNEKSETNITNANVYNYNDDSYQKEFPSDKGATVSPESMESGEPSHHARRPMNAFLIFCKRHRTIVKNRYPHLENRAVTKILGEWWAGLEPEDKACYTELAKQYKNAFFSANPNFKWYKLPAPPLRTLNTRPGNIVKSPPPTKESHENDEPLPLQQPPQQPQQPQQLFTPGKLADETQLGSITSLINSNNQHGGGCGGATKTILNNNNNNNKNKNKNNENDEQPVLNYKNYLLSPENSNLIPMCQPPKPFKKRLVLTQNTAISDAKNVVVRNIFTENNTGTNNKTEGNIFDSSLLQEALQSFVYDETFEGDFHLDSNLTQQELINKVVDHMCSSASSSKTDSNDGNPDGDVDADADADADGDGDDMDQETRKSVRSCKGLLYAKFMAEGKLFVSKRNRKALAGTKSPFASSNVSDKVPRNTEPIELSDTIKKLAERTIGNSSSAKTTTTSTTSTTPSISITNNYMKITDHEEQKQQLKNEQEQHEETMKKMFRAADFNLDEKIEALPSLSLDKFQQKKKENKKRKFLRATKMKDTERKKIAANPANKNTITSSSENEASRSEINLIGSRKRKPIGKPRKQNNNNNNTNNTNNNNNKDTCEIDLFGLATLAEVAAKKAKIDQK